LLLTLQTLLFLALAGGAAVLYVTQQRRSAAAV
jgi:hypothetical protein